MRLTWHNHHLVILASDSEESKTVLRKLIDAYRWVKASNKVRGIAGYFLELDAVLACFAACVRVFEFDKLVLLVNNNDELDSSMILDSLYSLVNLLRHN